MTTEQLLQGATRKRKGNEKGSNAHEKSWIWAAKDTEWKKLEEKVAVRILTGASAEKAKGPEEFKARWCVRWCLDPDVMELAGSGATQFPTVSQVGRILSCQMIVSIGWDLQLGDIRGRRFGSEGRITVLKSSSRRNPRSARWKGGLFACGVEGGRGEGGMGCLCGEKAGEGEREVVWEEREEELCAGRGGGVCVWGGGGGLCWTGREEGG